MVRRRTDESNTGRGITRFRNILVNLVSRKLPSLSGLGALGHLDLYFIGVGQVFNGYPEPAGCNLLDGGPLRISRSVRMESCGVFSTLAGIGLAAQPVH